MNFKIQSLKLIKFYLKIKKYNRLAANGFTEIENKTKKENIMIDTSPTRLLYKQTKEEDNLFGNWYRDNEISVENYWVFLQVFRLLKEGDNLGQLKSLIELVNPVEQRVNVKFADKVINRVPTTWLDPLLTGKDKILPDGYSYNPQDIENLLRAIKLRVKETVSKLTR